ncbi:hypothetical protein H671_20776 [Cricetulus griseus]|nr:hypothetical protein H671_20776 [Cricetulus griseus]
MTSPGKPLGKQLADQENSGEGRQKSTGKSHHVNSKEVAGPGILRGDQADSFKSRKKTEQQSRTIRRRLWICQKKIKMANCVCRILT